MRIVAGIVFYLVQSVFDVKYMVLNMQICYNGIGE